MRVPKSDNLSDFIKRRNLVPASFTVHPVKAAMTLCMPIQPYGSITLTTTREFTGRKGPFVMQIKGSRGDTITLPGFFKAAQLAAAHAALFAETGPLCAPPIH